MALPITLRKGKQMNPNNCPCCGRALPKTKAPKVVNVAELSDRDVFAYYKRTAPVENVKFQLRLTSLSADVRSGYETLLAQLEQQGGKDSQVTKREYLRLQQAWRESYRPRIVTRKTRSGWIVNQRIAA
jgi:hypothetical protein